MEKRCDGLLLFLLLSLLLHLLFAGAGAWVDLFHVRPVKPPEVVEVTLIPERPLQIADIPKPEKEQRPKKAKFAGIYDSSVDEEQVVPVPRPGGKGGAKKSATKIPAKNVLSGSGEMEGPDGLPGDFFPDHKIGDKTYLNVLRFPKVGYFVRLKKIFNTTWNPRPALTASLGANQISKGQVSVKLAVSIDRSGNLAELFVIHSSGLAAYDREAVRTIRDSSPFAAPPPDLLEGPSRLQMVWTFTVYL